MLSALRTCAVDNMSSVWPAQYFAMLKMLDIPQQPWFIIEYLRRVGAWDDVNNPHRMRAVQSKIAAEPPLRLPNKSNRPYAPQSGVVSLDDRDAAMVSSSSSSSLSFEIIFFQCTAIRLVEFASICNRFSNNF